MAYPKPRVIIPINRYVLSDIEACVRLSDKLPRILDTGLSIGPCADNGQFAEKVASALSLNSNEVESIIRVFVNFFAIKNRAEIDAHDFVGRFTDRINEEAPESWKETHSDGWQKIASDIADILSSITPDHPMLITGKAQTLTYTQQSILRDVRIITDVRPIFNEEADDILEFIVSHSLVLKHRDGTRETQSHISIDSADIEKIKKLCDRALEKSDTLRTILSGLEKKIIIVGKDDA